MAPRGLSAAEKRDKLLEIFHETKDFWQLKELEKLGPKMKGIVSQSVKEVLQSLVDDGLVQTDKVGASNLFWSYPSHRGTIIQNRLKTAEQSRDTQRSQQAELAEAIAGERAARCDSVQRRAALTEIAELRTELAGFEAELAQHGACDPVKVAEQRRALDLGKEASLRWTDNYLILLSYYTREKGIAAADIRAFLEIGEDYEDLVG